MRRGEIGKGCDCNTCRSKLLSNPHLKHIWNFPSHELLQTNYCTRNRRNNAIVSRPLRTIASHELLHELLRQKTIIAATPFAESTRPFSEHPIVGFGKRGLLEKGLEKGSFQKSPFSRDCRDFRDSRDSRESPDCGKQRRIRPFSRDSREVRDFRDSRDSSSEKTPFVMTPFFRSRNRGFQTVLSPCRKRWEANGNDQKRDPKRQKMTKWLPRGDQESETGRIRFRRARFQTPTSVSFLGLTEFRGANSVSSSRPIICV